MSASRHSRATQRFAVRGLQLAKNLDELDSSELAIYQNLRQFVIGKLDTRPGLTAINAAAMADLIVHSVRRLNNDLPSATQSFARVVGAGTSLYSDNGAHNAYTLRASGFSGRPLSLVPFRPEQSPEPWMYIGDASKSGKINVAGIFRNQGIAPPSAPPTGLGGVAIPTFPGPTRAVIDTLRSSASYTPTNCSLSTPTASTFIENILYDTGSTGWASINPTTFMNSMVVGSYVNFAHGAANENAVIEEVLPAMKSGTVSSITYDGGTTGLCTIVVSHPSHHRTSPNALIKINTEVVRVLSVSIGPDDVPSIRCSTTLNHVAGEPITGLTSFRVFLAGTYIGGGSASGDILNQMSVKLTMAAAGTGFADRTITLDLSNISGRVVQDTDEINIIITFTEPASTTEVQVMLDCDQSTNNFTQNYFIGTLRPSDLTSTLNQASPAVDTKSEIITKKIIDETPTGADESIAQTRARLQNRLAKLTQRNANPRRLRNLQARIDELVGDGGDGGFIDPPVVTPDPSSTSGVSGDIQRTLFKVKVGELIRVGSDSTVGLKDIKALRLLVVSTAAANVIFDSWWIGGTFGPDTGDIGTPYLYRYVYRASESGARSYPSPATRSGVLPKRQRVQLVATVSADAQVDKVDWYRFGGSLTDWIYLGTGPNTGVVFNDDFPDDAIASNPRIDFGKFQPFPLSDIPRTGTCNVSGTSVSRTGGDTFNVNWAAGSQVIVNGVPATIYRVISTILLETVENLGTLGGVSFFIPDALIQGQPLPAMWGPFGEGIGGVFMFACGAPNEPGTLLWTNGNDPDSADEKNRVEITSPSEPLMNGCVYDGRAYVWSTQRMWAVSMEPDPLTNRLTARPNEIPNGKGLFARFALAVGPKMWFIAQDGIYETVGAEPQLITSDLYPLFPHDGQPGAAVNGISPPDFSQPNSMDLNYADGMLYYDFVDLVGMRHTLVYNTLLSGWSYDAYTPMACTHYQEEGRGVRSVLLGGSDGRLYQFLQTALTDAGTPISCVLQTGAFDAGDFRAQKVWADLIVDYLSSIAITASAGFDNVPATTPLTNLAISASRTQQIEDLASGNGVQARNIILNLSWNGQASLFGWEPSWLPRPEDSALRATDMDDLGYDGAKFVQGIVIEADTSNVVKSILIQADTGVNGIMATQTGALTTIQHNGRSEQAYSFATPFIAHLVRILGNDSDPWKLFKWRWVFEPSPELVTDWITQPTTLDGEGFMHIREVQIAHISTANLTFSIITDDGTNAPITDTYTINHGNGVYKKTYIVTRDRKFKSVTFKLVSAAGFRVFQKDIEVRFRSWGQSGGYNIVKPFGDISRVKGAAI